MPVRQSSTRSWMFPGGVGPGRRDDPRPWPGRWSYRDPGVDLRRRLQCRCDAVWRPRRLTCHRSGGRYLDAGPRRQALGHTWVAELDRQAPRRRRRRHPCQRLGLTLRTPPSLRKFEPTTRVSALWVQTSTALWVDRIVVDVSRWHGTTPTYIAGAWSMTDGPSSRHSLLDRRDIVTVVGIPCTSKARTLVDLGSVVSADEVLQALSGVAPERHEPPDTP